MLEGAHPERHQRARAARADRDVFGELKAVSAAALLGLLATACDRGDPNHQPIDTPNVHVVAMRATTKYVGGHEQFGDLAKDGSSTVPINASFRVKFDRFLLPGVSPIRQSICIQSAITPVTTYADCKQGIMLQPAYDPTRREIVFRQPEGAPLLQKTTTYVLTVLGPDPANPDFESGIRAFDGAPLDTNVSVQFKTDASDALVPPQPAIDTFCSTSECDPRCNDFCKGDATCVASCKLNCGSVSTYFVTCAYGGCHASGTEAHGTDSVPIGPAEGLDLSDSSAIFRTAIGRVAHQTQEGEHANHPDESGPRFGRAMPIVDPTSPGNSYLLYKLLVSPLYTGDEMLDDAGKAQLVREQARLRDTVVVGLPMPGDGKSPIDQVQIELVNAWIESGAPVGVCP